MTVGDDKKPSLEELSHQGVLGMKWGHRKMATASQIIAARGKLNSQRKDLANQVDKVHDTTKKGTPARTKEVKKLQEMHTTFLKNPDRVVAARMTRGEKAAALVLGGPAGLAAILASSASSRRIEQKQDTGGFNKKNTPAKSKPAAKRQPGHARRGLSLMAVKEGTPQADRIAKASAARAKVNNATTVAQYNKALKAL